jgi:hypothetical protein
LSELRFQHNLAKVNKKGESENVVEQFMAIELQIFDGNDCTTIEHR